MPDRIFIPPDESSSDVVKIGDACFERVGPSGQAPTVSSIDEEFDSCNECEGVYYKLVSCQNDEVVYTLTDLSTEAASNDVILTNGDCWTVYDPDGGSSPTIDASGYTVEDDCEDEDCPVVCDDCGEDSGGTAYTQDAATTSTTATGCNVSDFTVLSPIDWVSYSDHGSGECAWQWQSISGNYSTQLNVFKHSDGTWDANLSAGLKPDSVYYDSQMAGTHVTGLKCNSSTNKLEGTIIIPEAFWWGASCTGPSTITVTIG